MAIPLHKSLAQTGKVVAPIKGGKSTPQSFKDGGKVLPAFLKKGGDKKGRC